MLIDLLHIGIEVYKFDRILKSLPNKACRFSRSFADVNEA